MKARMIAAFLIAAVATSPLQAAYAGPLTDAVRGKLGAASFVAKVAKANLKNAIRRVLQR